MTRSLRFILVASLTLNLALGAGVAWLAFQSSRPTTQSQARDPRPMFRPDALRQALRPERGPLVDRVLENHRDTMRAHIGRLSEARAGVREAILAEPFERQRLDAAFARLREVEGSTAQEAHALLSDLVEQAEPAERQGLARLVSGRHERRAHSDRHVPPH